MRKKNYILPSSLAFLLLCGTVFAQAQGVSRTVRRSDVVKNTHLTKALSSEDLTNSSAKSVAKKADATSIFFENFATEAGFNKFVVVNSNDDDKTWALATGEQKSCAKCDSHSTNFSDDWIITPKITLSAGRIYTISFKAASRGPFYPEALEVKWGTSATVAAMTNTLMAKTEIKTERNKWSDYDYTIKATEQMDIYIGFHAVSNPNSFTLYVTDITVDNGRDMNAPDKVTNLTITPDMTGAAKATVKFKAPTKSISGTTLASLDNILIERDGELKHTITGAVPGQEYSWEDEVPQLGTFTWSVTATNSYGEGLKENASKYIGEDIPARPENLKMVDNGDNTATMTWNPVTIGANGGFVDTSKLYYKIYNVIDNRQGEQIDEVEEPSVTSPDLDIDNGDARLEYLVVSAANKAGESDVAIGMLVAGTPAELPYKESFSSPQGTDNFIWTQATGNSNMDLLDELSSDDDGWCLAYMSMNIGDKNWINTEKISFVGVQKPKLTFDVFPGDPAGFDGDVTIKIEASVEQTGEADIELGSVDLSTLNAYEWNEVSFDLTPLTGKKYAILKVQFHANDAWQFVYFDNLQVRDMVDHNLALTMTAPAEVIVQQPAHIEMTVRNTGMQTAPAGQTVELYVNDALVNTLQTSELASENGVETLAYDYSSKVTEGDILKVKAVLTYADDENPTDNEATATIEVIPNAVPTVNVEIEASDNGITLNWNRPTLYQLGTVIEEGFDDESVYEPFSTGGIDKYTEYGMIGDWFMWDADAVHTYTFANHDNYPNAAGIMAWQVFKPEEVFDFEGTDAVRKDVYVPHSGKQYMAAFGSEVQGGVEPSDNWLVSPELDRSQQTIKFYTKSLNRNYTPETIEVRYSTEDIDWADYRLLTTINQTTEDWVERTVTLPYGTMFFALRHTSTDKFVVVVDDITYRNATPSGEGDAMTIVGYRIYRDGELIATVGADETNFTDGDADDGEHTYTVTVVYDPDVESPMSEPVVITGINDVTTVVASENTNIFATDGRLVAIGKDAQSRLKPGVYVVKDNNTGKTSTIIKR